MDSNAALRELFRLTDPSRPPPAELYVRGKRSVVVDVVQEILLAPAVSTKHLLYGSTGTGKSTQLRDIANGLSQDMTVVDVDFDYSGISVSGISAFDLAYVIALRALAHLRQDRDQAELLFKKLTEAYADDDEADVSALGKLEQALPGVAGFGDAVLAIAKEAGAAMLPGVSVVSGVKVAMNLLRLRTKRAGLVSEASPRGRRMQDATEAIFAAVRQVHGGRPIAVLLDGLEKVNGEAGRWMRETFEYTRLLTDASVTVVAATPSCPFKETNSTLAAGWTPQAIYGFAPDDLPTLALLMRKRVAAASIDPRSSGLDHICDELAAAAGGHARHAIHLLRAAVMNALKAGRVEVLPDDVSSAIQKLREQLAMGLTEGHYAVLRRVNKLHQLPNDDLASSLFGDGQILVHPPTPRAPHQFHVHPLLLPWVEGSVESPPGDS